MTRRDLIRRLVLMVASASALGALVSACDDVEANPIIQSPSSRFGGGPDAGLRVNRTPPASCSSSPPRTNSACNQPGSVCEYGESPDQACNTLLACANDPTYGAYWEERGEPRCALSCPDPSLIVDGAPCDLADAGGPEAELHCAAPQGFCACTTGRDGAHAHERKWVCTRPAEGCPARRPLLGQPCVGTGACDYGSCSSKRGMRMICADEVWQTEIGSCDD